MADLGIDFDPASVPADDRSFDVIPAGQYEAQIVGSEVRATKSGGKLVAFQWEILGPHFANRRVFQNINIENDSAKAQEIGQRELANICEATDSGVIHDTEELHYKPCLIVVGIERQEGYADKNNVKRVKPLGGAQARPAAATPATPRTAAAAPAARPAPQAAAAGSRPWKR